jgi:hypothetical protein
MALTTATTPMIAAATPLNVFMFRTVALALACSFWLAALGSRLCAPDVISVVG